MASRTDVAIIGAGPYGLSIAAHLLDRKIETQVFGSPMKFWATTLSAGKLKSEGFATNLSEPTGRFTLGAYCAENGEPYAPTGLPIPFKTFTAYGLEFQRRYVPNLQNLDVTRIEPAGDGFSVRLEDGRSVAARRVILATGVAPYAFTPSSLLRLPQALRSHSAHYGDVRHLAGKKIVVVGSGASATDLAAHLTEAGAHTTLVMRRPELRFQSSLGVRSVADRIRAPMTELGPGWKSVLCVKAPLLFHAMPEAFRLDVVRRYLGPAPAWYVRDRVEGLVDVLTSTDIDDAIADDGGVRLRLRTVGKGLHEIRADHVIAATGFKIDAGHIDILGAEIRDGLATAADRSPILSSNFESSIPGLYFVGTAAANSFGPMLRFVCGAPFAAHRIARHVAYASARRPAPPGRQRSAEAADLAA